MSYLLRRRTRVRQSLQRACSRATRHTFLGQLFAGIRFRRSLPPPCNGASTDFKVPNLLRHTVLFNGRNQVPPPGLGKQRERSKPELVRVFLAPRKARNTGTRSGGRDRPGASSGSQADRLFLRAQRCLTNYQFAQSLIRNNNLIQPCLCFWILRIHRL